MVIKMSKSALKHIIETVPGEAIIHIIVEPIETKNYEESEEEMSGWHRPTVSEALEVLDDVCLSMYGCVECSDREKCADVKERCELATKIADELWNMADDLYDAVEEIMGCVE